MARKSEVNLNVQYANKTSPFPWKFQILLRHNTALKRSAYCVLNCIRGSLFLEHREQIVSLLAKAVVPILSEAVADFCGNLEVP